MNGHPVILKTNGEMLTYKFDKPHRNIYKQKFKNFPNENSHTCQRREDHCEHCQVFHFVY